MIVYLMRRLAAVMLILLGVSAITYVLLYLLPADPVDLLAGRNATPEIRENLRRELGLDQPLPVQYAMYLGKLAQGDMGRSLAQKVEVSYLIEARLPATLQLAGLALAISVAMALPFGVLTAVWKDRLFDSVGKVFALLGQSLPTFWLGIVLMWIFAVMLGWLPTSGRGGIKHMILPAVCLGWFQVATMMRLIRSSMLDVLDSEFVKLTRVKGLPEWKVVWKHCLRNAAIAPLTYFAITTGVLITGSVVTESVFAWPGTGLLVVDAVRARDFQVVQAIVIIFAAVFTMTNLVVDILYAYIDPRIRYQ